MPTNLRRSIIIDNHAHPVATGNLQYDRTDFRACFSESREPEMLRQHVNKHVHYMDLLDRLSRLLGSPKAGIEQEEDLLRRRSEQTQRDYIRMLWDDACIGAAIIDDGFASERMITLTDFGPICQRPIYRCRRIEPLLESCLTKAASFDELSAIFARELVAESAPQLVSLKTICAYRGGLSIEHVSTSQAKADFDRVKGQFSGRITSGPLYHYFLMQAFELADCHNLPVQVHCGIGDDDANLLESNPALLQNLFKTKTLASTKFVLLHCYPYVREAAIMCALYPNVYMDLSLTSTLATAMLPDLIREVLAQAPASKFLAGTDGHSVPEAHWYGALRWKEALAQALDVMSASGCISAENAAEIASLVLYDNARRLYQLEGLA